MCRNRDGRTFRRHWFGAFSGTRTGGDVRCQRCGVLRAEVTASTLKQLLQRRKVQPLAPLRLGPIWKRKPSAPPTPLAAKVYLPPAGTLARQLLSGKV